VNAGVGAGDKIFLVADFIGLVWNSSFGSMVSHTTFYTNKDLF
jgi:hypothetical protein